jgi:hypothetical protein
MSVSRHTSRCGEVLKRAEVVLKVELQPETNQPPRCGRAETRLQRNSAPRCGEAETMLRRPCKSLIFGLDGLNLHNVNQLLPHHGRQFRHLHARKLITASLNCFFDGADARKARGDGDVSVKLFGRLGYFPKALHRHELSIQDSL